MFNCDSLWCCWSDLIHFIGRVAWRLRYPALVYAALYVIGAASFLLTLRIQSTDERLVVDKRSWAYAVAHPMRYGVHRYESSQSSSICAFYATMFNMLLFAWPFLLIFFFLGTVLGSIVLFAVASTVIWPNLRCEAFMDYCNIFTTKKGNPFPMVLITLPIVLLGIAGWKFTAFLHLLSVIGWALLCLIPVLAAIGIVVLIIVKGRAKDDNAVAATFEVIAAKKEKFCKIVEFK